MSRVSLRQKLLVGALAVAAPTALLGAAHTGAGTPWLARLGGAGCPLATPSSPAQLEAQRKGAMENLRGASPAPSRPALGLGIETSSPDEVRAWAAARGMRCEESPAESALRCNGEVARGAISDVFARFDERDRLVVLDVFRAGASAPEALARFDELQRSLAGTLGPPSSVSGEATTAYLEAAPLRRAAIAYRFLDFAADVSAVNQARSGVVLREQYRSIPPRSGG